MNRWDHISTDPCICHGMPCIKGTRVRMAVILGALAGGASFDEIVEEYPPLTEDDIRAVLACAGLLADEQYEPLENAFTEQGTVLSGGRERSKVSRSLFA